MVVCSFFVKHNAVGVNSCSIISIDMVRIKEQRTDMFKLQNMVVIGNKILKSFPIS